MQKAIVMAGGQGTRLWPLTEARPKPLVPIANRPVLAYILEWLRASGITEVLLTLHFQAEAIRRVLGDGASYGLRLSYCLEERPLGTAGAVKQAEAWIGDEPFLIVSGDALTDVDLASLVRWHRESGACLTLGLQRVADPSAYGVVELDPQGRVKRFQEKPAPGQAFSSLVNTGIYCVQPHVLQCIPIGRPYDWSRDVFPDLLARGQSLSGTVLRGYWCDIGSLRDYRRAQRDALAGKVHARLAGIELAGEVWVGPRARIAPGAVVRGPALLGAGCRIERGAWVLPGSVVGEGTVVSAAACLWGAIVGDGCRIGPGAILRNTVLDEGVSAGAACFIADETVIGRGCSLAPGVSVSPGVRVEPKRRLTRSPEGEEEGRRGHPEIRRFWLRAFLRQTHRRGGGAKRSPASRLNAAPAAAG